MASISEKFQRLALSANEIKELNPQWSDAMVEDYLEILNDLFVLAEGIDTGDSNLTDVENTLSEVSSITGKNRALINKSQLQIANNSTLISDGQQENEGRNGLLSKVKAVAYNNLFKIYNWIPLKGVFVVLNGNGASAPVLVNSYNVDAATVTRAGVGQYDFTIEKNTFFGQVILNSGAASYDWLIAPSANTDVFKVQIAPISLTTLRVFVYEVTTALVGNGLVQTPYDFQNGDRIDIQILFNYKSALPPA